MGRPPRVDFPGAIHHAYSRGNHRQRIFFIREDWERFLDILEELKKTRPFRLHGYALMPNHFHLLIETLVTPLSKIMDLLLTRYSKYLNARLKRTGHVFQSRFRERICANDPYFKHLVRYIHLNAVRAGIVTDPASWPYSGHLEYLGRGTRNLIDQKFLLSMFHDDITVARGAYQRFVEDGMPGGPDAASAVHPPTDSSAPKKPIHVPSRLIELSEVRVPLEKLAADSATAGISMELLRGPSRAREVCRVRRVFMQRAFLAGYTPTEIAEFLSLTVSAVSKALIQKQVE
ncbi:MAG: hypothetical protein A2X36_09640 [Elusimicrobia bacterium GWA2_69_24]|nr:MAG: hypothetical protein A2X36_09640 [Elusimicrobia bacterium GWA2_69_24]